MDISSPQSITIQNIARLLPGRIRCRAGKWAFLMALLTSMTVALGCIPAGAIRFSPDAADAMEGYRRDTENRVKMKIRRHFVLHRAGSFQEYAKNINASGFRYPAERSGVTDVVALMDRSFGELDADGIEIDLQLVPECSELDGVYIVHDPIGKERDLSSAAAAYLCGNSLEKVLTHYIRRRYFEVTRENGRARHLYLELKFSKGRLRLRHPELIEKEENDLKKIASGIRAIVRERTDDAETRSRIREHIAFVSFNLNALAYMHALHEEREEEGHRYFFIAATNRPWLGRAATLWSDEINYVDRRLIDRIAACPWLSGIWFDPQGMRSLVETFNAMNGQRGDRPLEIHISTYKLPKKKYLRRLKKEARTHEDETVGRLRNVGGLIFDIQRFP